MLTVHYDFQDWKQDKKYEYSKTKGAELVFYFRYVVII